MSVSRAAACEEEEEEEEDAVEEEEDDLSSRPFACSRVETRPNGSPPPRNKPESDRAAEREEGTKEEATGAARGATSTFANKSKEEVEEVD